MCIENLPQLGNTGYPPDLALTAAPFGCYPAIHTIPFPSPWWSKTGKHIIYIDIVYISYDTTCHTATPEAFPFRCHATSGSRVEGSVRSTSTSHNILVSQLFQLWASYNIKRGMKHIMCVLGRKWTGSAVHLLYNTLLWKCVPTPGDLCIHFMIFFARLHWPCKLL